MKKQDILNECTNKMLLYRDIYNVVEKLELKKIYRITYAYIEYTRHLDGQYHMITKNNTIIGEVIHFNSESIRVKVIAADLGVEKWGSKKKLSTERGHRNRRQDTLSIKYEMLTMEGCSFDPIDPEDLATYIGCEFIHPDIRKHLENA